MNKITCFFLFSSLWMIPLSAQEPTMAILESVTTNSTQKFTLKNYNFYCEPYGVISLEKVYNNSVKGSNCRKSIDAFYRKNPHLKYFTEELLKVKQMYHLEFKEKKCILYAQGQKTLSELLIEEGLAVKEPAFEDEEFRFYFAKAQINAKILKSGMWETTLEQDCAAELK